MFRVVNMFCSFIFYFFIFVVNLLLIYLIFSLILVRNKEVFGIVVEVINNDYGGVERCLWFFV